VVEIVYAEAGRAIVKTYALKPAATVADALRLAAADAAFCGVDIAHVPVGVFGKPATADQILEDGDRIEIYRPLAADPKVARRNRAKEQLRR
jgi:putative ubiquitin-RnfH superfamily antitoxin RatB of RatAB toxin-antitoxin module